MLPVCLPAEDKIKNNVYVNLTHETDLDSHSEDFEEQEKAFEEKAFSQNTKIFIYSIKLHIYDMSAIMPGNEQGSTTIMGA